MPVIRELYDHTKVESLKRYLEREAERNRSKDYEIIIDNYKVVSRTNNVEEFDDHEQEMKENSRSLTIVIYDSPNANRNNKYIFSLNGSIDMGGKSLGGLGEIDQMIQQRLNEKDREYEMQRLKEKLADTETKLAEAEEYGDLLEKTIEDLKNKRLTDNGNIGEILNALVGSVLKNNAKKIPGGELLAGIFVNEADSQAAQLPQETEVSGASYQKRDAAGQADEMTQHRLALIADLQKKLNEHQMTGLFTIVEYLTNQPEQIQTVIEILDKK